MILLKKKKKEIPHNLIYQESDGEFEASFGANLGELAIDEESCGGGGTGVQAAGDERLPHEGRSDVIGPSADETSHSG